MSTFGSMIGGGASASLPLFIGGRAIGTLAGTVATGVRLIRVNSSAVMRARASASYTLERQVLATGSANATLVPGSGTYEFQNVKLVNMIRSATARAQASADFEIVADKAHAQLFVRGVRLALTPQVNTMQIKRALNSASECTFTLHDTTQSAPVVRGADVTIYWRTERIFAGIVRSASRTSFHATSAHTLRVTCSGYAGLLAKRMVTYKYDPESSAKTLRTIVYDMWLTFFANRGEAIYFNSLGCPAIAVDEPFEVDFESMLDAMTRLCDLTSTAFDVDETRTIQVYEVQSTSPTAAFHIQDNNGKYAALNVDESDNDYANAIVLRTATALDGEWTDTYKGENTLYQWFALTYTPIAGTTPRVYVNGVLKTLVSELSSGLAYDFSWLPGFPSVFPRTEPTPLVPFALTDTIEIKYRVQGNNSLSVRDEAEIAARRVVELGSGVHEIFVDIGDKISDAAAAREYVNALLARKVLGTQTFAYESSERMRGMTLAQLLALRPGQVQEFDTTQPIENANAMIESIELRDVDGQFLAARVNASLGRVRESWDRKLTRLLTKRTPKSNAQDMYGFVLAEDIPGKFNRGLVVTDTQVLTRFIDRACVFTSAVITSTNPAQGSAVILDVFINNVSLFASPVECAAGVERTVASIENVSAKQYDRLAIKVLAIGSDAPGKSYAVRLHGIPTGTDQTSGFVDTTGNF